jgi:hypothetical protein
VVEHNKRGRYPSDKPSVKISPTQFLLSYVQFYLSLSVVE